MKSFFNLFVRSAKELRSLRCLCVVAMLIALDLVLKLTVSIEVTSHLKISFAFIALASIGMLYGPTVSFAAGIVTDILGFIIEPSGAFDIRFTLIEALGALLYGLFLYNAVNDKWMLPRIVAAKSTVVIVCNLFLTTVTIAAVYGNGFFAIFPARALANLAQLPLDVFLLFIFLPIILKAYNTVFKGARKVDQNSVFSDAGMGTAIIYVVCLMFIAVCSLGIAGQSLDDKSDELEDRLDEQSEQLEVMQTELDNLYSELDITKPQTASAEE